MRVLLTIEIGTAQGNEQIQAGRMGEVMQRLLGELKPEVAYFHAVNGNRGMTLVVDAPDSASLPSLAEPFWLELGARVQAVPCMNADELAEGLGRLG